MRSLRRRSPRGPAEVARGVARPGRHALMAGVALAGMWSGVVHAQPVAAPVPDGLEQGELYMEADEVVREDKSGRTTANGNIEVRHNGRTLRADHLTYDDQSGVIRADGHVTVVNADGTTESADQIVLDEDMRAGVAMGFSARLPDNVKIAAASAARRDENFEELNKAIYTPCDICAKDGSSRTPTWSIAADRVIRDKKKRIIYYRNARFRLFGAPVAYLPVFWHADPQAPRSSGFLVPKASASDRRGPVYRG